MIARAGRFVVVAWLAVAANIGQALMIVAGVTVMMGEEVAAVALGVPAGAMAPAGQLGVPVKPFRAEA